MSLEDWIVLVLAMMTCTSSTAKVMHGKPFHLQALAPPPVLAIRQYGVRRQMGCILADGKTLNSTFWRITRSSLLCRSE